MKLKTAYRIMLPTLAAAAFSNVALSVYLYFRLKSPVAVNVQVIEPPKIEFPAITNETISVRSGLLSPVSNSSRGSPSAIPSAIIPQVWKMEYHYCVVSGSRIAILNGVTIREGDQHAFGVVSAIYPERIYFTSGDYIENSQRKGVQNVSISGGTVADY